MKNKMHSTILVLIISASTALGADIPSLVHQISQQRLFQQPILWVGSAQPDEGESQALLSALDISSAEPNRLTTRIQSLESFIAAYPNSGWTPSIQANLAAYYRSSGRYTKALSAWESAWATLKDFQSGNGRHVADYVLASWSGLLSSLGRLDALRALQTASAGRVLSDLEWERRFSASMRNLKTMQERPGESYRCGTFALISAGRSMGAKFDMEALKKVPSPETGFSLARLVGLAREQKLDLVPAHRLAGEDLVVPSVAHFRQNHYAAILAYRNGYYHVTDPTFGPSRWLALDAINEEASGYFLVPAERKPVGWVTPSEQELSLIFGKGQDNQPPPPPPPPCNASPTDSDTCPPKCKFPWNFGPPGPPGDGPGCPTCKRKPRSNILPGDTQPPYSGSGFIPGDGYGMPEWSVAEPYISVQLRDAPVGYAPGRGGNLSVKLYYSEHEGRPTNYFGFGPQWCSSLLSYMRIANDINDDSPDFKEYQVTVYGLGGGQLAFSHNDTCADRSTFTTFDKGTPDIGGGVTNPIVHYPDGSMAVYGVRQFIQDTPAIRDFFLIQYVDSHGNTTTFNYTTTNDIVRLINIVDADGNTNTVFYDATWTISISEIDTPTGVSAKFRYDANGVLTNIIDALGMTNSFLYNLIGGYYVVTNLTTPYGNTSFSYLDPVANLYGGSADDDINRAVTITEPNGANHLFLYRDQSFRSSGGTEVYTIAPYTYSDVPDYLPINATITAALCNYNMIFRNSFYWGPRQYAALSTTTVTSLTTNDYKLARLRNWLHTDNSDYYAVCDTLNMERQFSPDGSTEGQKTWYGYAGRVWSYHFESHTNNFPSHIAQRLPDGGTRYTYLEYNAQGSVTLQRTTNIVNGVGLGEKTRTFTYDTDGINLLLVTNYSGVQEAAYGYNGNRYRIAFTNAVGDVTLYTYDVNANLTSILTPAGLTATNIYGGDGRLSQTVDLEISRTNSYTWINGQVYTHKDERGMTITNSWDALRRLTNVAYPDGTSIKYTFDKLDLTQIVDRMGFTNKFTYDSVRNRTSSTDPRGNKTALAYCTCGSLDYITNALNQVTHFGYDSAGRLTTTFYPDPYNVTNSFDLLGQLLSVSDGQGSTTNSYDNHGFLLTVSNAMGQVSSRILDIEDRATNTVDANAVNIGTTFDDAGRVVTRTFPDTGVEKFGYSALGLVAYTNQLSNVTRYFYDPALRKTKETNANNEVTQFSYSAAGDLLTLTDRNNNVTTWHYDQYGRATNKVDAASNIIFVYKYDANDRLTNRWTPAKTNTFYKYDSAGNLTNIAYPVSSSISMSYDALNRVQTMVDGIGTTSYAFTSGGQLQSEDGPWASDTVTYTYQNRLRTGLNLQAPNASDWVQSYGYDGARRMGTLTSPAGTFSYTYDPTAQMQVKKLSLPNGAYITNSYDNVARMLSTVLENSGNSVLNSHSYGYNVGNQRTVLTNVLGDFRNYSYDKIGQLKTAIGFEPGGTTNRWQEQFGYAYDAAGNLNYRTNNALVQTFNVNSLNELTSNTRAGTLTVAGTTTAAATNVTVNTSNAVRYADSTFGSTNQPLVDGTNTFTAIGKDNLDRANTNIVTAYLPATVSFQYDANGNLTNDGIRSFAYDDENQLTNVSVAGSFKSEFSYDGRMRRRIRREYAWQSGAFRLTNEVHYVYDGNRAIEERDANNLPQIAYTRGNDLSGNLEGAGGIGGLLAFSQLSTLSPQHAYYSADGNGNVTMLIGGNQLVAARYLYDPFGNTISSSGPLVDANLYRFSSKEAHSASGLIYYLYRFYDPGSQRWPNADPAQEFGGINLYAFANNMPPYEIDTEGLSIFGGLPPGGISGPFKPKPTWPSPVGIGISLASALIDLSDCSGGCPPKSEPDCESCCQKVYVAKTALNLAGAAVGCVGSGGILCLGNLAVSIATQLGINKTRDDCIKNCQDNSKAKPVKGRAGGYL